MRRDHAAGRRIIRPGGASPAAGDGGGASTQQQAAQAGSEDFFLLAGTPAPATAPPAAGQDGSKLGTCCVQRRVSHLKQIARAAPPDCHFLGIRSLRSINSFGFVSPQNLTSPAMERTTAAAKSSHSRSLSAAAASGCEGRLGGAGWGRAAGRVCAVRFGRFL